jgi:hypothetical protein
VAYDHIDVQSMPVTEDTLATLNHQLCTLDDMNDFLYKIGVCFVGNKSQLAQWIKGIQEGFAQFYVVAKQLCQESLELEVLKDFLVGTIENLKQCVNDLNNEKEDMTAIHQSDSGVKEHLIARVNELEKVSMERSTELVFARRTVSQITEEKVTLEERATSAVKELTDFKAKAKREMRVLKDHI